MEAEQPSQDAVGRRVSCGAERATVRYLGPVPPTEGLWLGVEWDNPDRGKHDGSHGGVSYFSCRNPKGGSFVRLEKVSFGVDFLNAVRQVYKFDAEEVLSEEINISSKRLEWEHVEERSLETLPSVVLTRCEVNGPGPSGDIRKTTPNVRWLDLSRTLLCCWDDVASITQQLEQLETLQLSYNRLRLPSDPSHHLRAFSSLRVLALIGCCLTWPQILVCASMWPQLEDLCLEENDITQLQRPEGVLQSLKRLSLSSNPVDQDSVLSLSDLPRLELLNMSRTGLSEIRFNEAAPGSTTALFPALKSLNLDHNHITEWSVVDEFSKLSSLVHFSCQGNKLLSRDGNFRTANQMIIAKLGRLEVLNRTTIQAEDRRGAELDYIKMFGEEWLKAGGRSQTSTEFTNQHPRYMSLIEKYGAPDEGELKKPQPFALKNQLLKIQFVFPDDGDRKPMEKKLPASMLVQKVKGLLYRILKVPAAQIRLSYSSPKMLGTEFEMDSDLKTLQFYSIEDGDQVLVRWS